MYGELPHRKGLAPSRLVQPISQDILVCLSFQLSIAECLFTAVEPFRLQVKSMDLVWDEQPPGLFAIGTKVLESEAPIVQN